MNIIYYIKEIAYNIIIYLFLILTAIVLFTNHNLLLYMYDNKNINVSNINIFILELPHQVAIKKLEWFTEINKKNIIHIEFYTLETIYYKMLLFYFIIITLTYVSFFLIKWHLNILYIHEKKKYIFIYIITYMFFITDYYNSTWNTTNIKNKLIQMEKINYFNLYLEPQITMESLLDTKIFFFFLIFIKYFYIYITFFLKKKLNILLRYTLIIFFFYFLHIDFLYIIYNMIEIEILYIIFHIITLYYHGDDRN